VSVGTATRDISDFGGGRSAVEDVTPELVGFKAYNLMRMDRAGLLIPPGFVLHTSLCRDFLAGGGLPRHLEAPLQTHLRRLEDLTGFHLGDPRRPLLVSVRSGAAVSMAGMMDTLLNIGLNQETVRGLVRRTGNPHLAWDSYRRLVTTYAALVDGVHVDFESVTHARLEEEQLGSVDELDSRSMRALANESFTRARAAGATVPSDPHAQLLGAIGAVFRSWNGERAVAFRRLHGLDETMGTAVIVQAMVFGNAGSRSGAGVGFTRNPSTGADELYFDFAFDAQGEDVVAGRHAPTDPQRLVRAMPDLYADLLRVRRALELEFGDMQDFEFTVEDGQLFMLQTRTGKRTPLAAVRIALAMADEGLIDPRAALALIDQVDLDALSEDELDTAGVTRLASATPASSGVVVGSIALDSDAARAAAAGGAQPILVREAASTDDIEGFAVAGGILTASGGRTCHAAVVARQMAKACLVACPTLEIDLQACTCTIGGHRLAEGATITIDGNDGAVYEGSAKVVHGELHAELAAIERLRAFV
jgi:pyruvate,orthophosphate dikinase